MNQPHKQSDAVGDSIMMVMKFPQPIRSLKLGHVTGHGSLSPTWVGRMSDLQKNCFHRKENKCIICCIFDDILKIKVKK